MKQHLLWFIRLLGLLGLMLPGLVGGALARAPQDSNTPQAITHTHGSPGWIERAELPAEARTTLRLIEQGGPFPHARDGIIFGNREKRLPIRPRGHYREYTVPTPGVRHRGARRIVHGGDIGSGEYYYTADHYHSFRRIRP